MNEPSKAPDPIRTFYAKYGLSLSKLAGGEVRVTFHSPSLDFPDIIIVLDCDTWASGVAGMSAEGDTVEGFEIARGFHLQGLKRVRFDPPIAI